MAPAMITTISTSAVVGRMVIALCFGFELTGWSSTRSLAMR